MNELFYCLDCLEPINDINDIITNHNGHSFNKLQYTKENYFDLIEKYFSKIDIGKINLDNYMNRKNILIDSLETLSDSTSELIEKFKEFDEFIKNTIYTKKSNLKQNCFNPGKIKETIKILNQPTIENITNINNINNIINIKTKLQNQTYTLAINIINTLLNTINTNSAILTTLKTELSQSSW